MRTFIEFVVVWGLIFWPFFIGFYLGEGFREWRGTIILAWALTGLPVMVIAIWQNMRSRGSENDHPTMDDGGE